MAAAHPQPRLLLTGFDAFPGVPANPSALVVERLRELAWAPPDVALDYAILPTNISVEPLALGIRKNEPALKAAIDGTLRELESSGKADKLFVEWYGPATKLQFDKRTFKIDSYKVES